MSKPGLWTILSCAVALCSLIFTLIVVMDDGARYNRFVDRVLDERDDLGARYSAIRQHQEEAITALTASRFELTEAAKLMGRNAKESSSVGATTLAAWAVLTNGTAGDLGKSQAFDHLAKNGARFEHLDLSCPQVTPQGNCVPRVEIRHITLDGTELYFVDFSHLSMVSVQMKGGRLNTASLNKARLYDLSMDGTIVKEVDMADTIWQYGGLRNVQLSDIDLSGAQFRAGKILDSSLWGVNFDGAMVEYVDFTGSDLHRVSFRGAGLSGSKFADAKLLEDLDLTGAWAWSDQMPTGLDAAQIAACSFPPDVIRGSSPVRRTARPAEC